MDLPRGSRRPGATALKRSAYFSSVRRRATKRRRLATGEYGGISASLAQNDGLFAASINGDAFSDEIKRAVADLIRKQMAPVDLLIYSLASPKLNRLHARARLFTVPFLKPIGQAAFTNRTIELDSEKVVSVTLPPASEDEIAGTVAVMGGEDHGASGWKCCSEEKHCSPRSVRLHPCLTPTSDLKFLSVADSIADGTIGQAKKDLERAAADWT